MDLNIKVRDFKKQKFIVIGDKRHHGDIDEARSFIMDWLERYDLVNISGEFAFAFYLPDDPSDEIHSEIMIPTKQSQKEDNIKIVRGKDQKVVSGLYKGPYTDLTSVHVIIRDYIHANNMEVSHFPMERYLNNFLEVKYNEILTEIQIPVLDYKFNMDVSLESIERKKIEPCKTAVIEHTGPIQDKNSVEDKLEKWVVDNELDHGDFYFKFVTHPDAELPADNIFQVGVLLDINETVNESKEIKIRNIPPHDDLVAIYKGPYQNLYSAHRLVRRYASENNWHVTNLPIEIYLNDPFEVKAEDLLTEIRLPVKYFEFDKTLKLESITEKIIKGPEYVLHRYNGPIQELNAVKENIYKWNKKHNIKVHDSYFVRFFTDPFTIFPDRSFFEVGFLTKTNTEINDKVRVVEFPEHQILTTIYNGPYEDLKKVHKILREYGMDKGLELTDFHREKYFNRISQTSKDNLLTEIQIPINIK